MKVREQQFCVLVVPETVSIDLRLSKKAFSFHITVMKNRGLDAQFLSESSYKLKAKRTEIIQIWGSFNDLKW